MPTRYNATIMLVNDAGETIVAKGTLQVTITVEAPLAVAPVSGIAGQPLPPMHASGGDGGPYKFSNAQNLPAGVTGVNEDGSFVGKPIGDPNKTVTYTITVDVADSEG